MCKDVLQKLPVLGDALCVGHFRLGGHYSFVAQKLNELYGALIFITYSDAVGKCFTLYDGKVYYYDPVREKTEI